MENYAEIREKAWAAINAARQQENKIIIPDVDVCPAKVSVKYVDSPKQLMELLRRQISG